MPDQTKHDETNDLDNFENYFQNAIASMANVGTFSLAPVSVTELTVINPNGIETNNNLSEEKEKVEMLRKGRKADNNV